MPLYNREFWQQVHELTTLSEIVIDRPRKSTHPRYPNFVYPVDYDFLKNTKASDGNAIDIWVGTSAQDQINGILCTVDPIKKDLETTIVYRCTEDEIALIYNTMNAVMKAIYISKKS